MSYVPKNFEVFLVSNPYLITIYQQFLGQSHCNQLSIIFQHFSVSFLISILRIGPAKGCYKIDKVCLCGQVQHNMAVLSPIVGVVNLANVQPCCYCSCLLLLLATRFHPVINIIVGTISVDGLLNCLFHLVPVFVIVARAVPVCVILCVWVCVLLVCRCAGVRVWFLAGIHYAHQRTL